MRSRDFFEGKYNMSDYRYVGRDIGYSAQMEMLDQEHESDATMLRSAYPALADIEDLAWKQAIKRAKKIHVVAGSIMLHDQIQAKEFKMLITGRVRVYHAAPDGREITLYRIKAGGLCVISLNDLFNEQSHSIIAEAETDVYLLCINEMDFHMSMRESDIFRNYVLSNLNLRIIELMGMIQDTAFNTLGLRLACLLGSLFEREQATKLKSTHQLLARELGTTREVISRILKEFERKGCIKLSRGYIQLVSQKALSNYSQTI